MAQGDGRLAAHCEASSAGCGASFTCPRRKHWNSGRLFWWAVRQTVVSILSALASHLRSILIVAVASESLSRERKAGTVPNSIGFHSSATQAICRTKLQLEGGRAISQSTSGFTKSSRYELKLEPQELDRMTALDLAPEAGAGLSGAVQKSLAI